ncbi:YaiI/YqxD family protein [Spiribacter sp. 218]|uniref:YaiI/YqxD family protein n=1 Tax=Spiribacter pallidus TaxID=1987936 RepID=UPI00349FCA83
MHLWVDADACPGVIKEILFRAAERVGIRLTLIANQPIQTPPSKLIDSVQVAAGFDVADDEIVRCVSSGDLVVTADIPLAAEVIEKGALVLTPRGEAQTRENIRSRLQMRDFMETLRGSGIHTGGPSALTAADRKRFADALDRYLATAGE